MKRRDNFIYVFIGTNRTGKSLTLRKQIIIWKRANPGKLVIGFDPQRRFRDLLDIVIKPDDENWALEMLERRDCLLVVDDLRKLHDSSHPPDGLKLLMYDFCDYNIDIMFVFHNPTDVLNAILNHATHYFIFLINAQEGKFKLKMPNYRLCMAASDEVNNYVAKHGRGSFPKCDFPYIYIDTEKRKLIAINMNKQY